MNQKLIILAGIAASMILIYSSEGAYATIKYFYSDGVIEDGDEYDGVSVYDTPPFQTTVDMTGGTVGRAGDVDTGMFTYDSSTVNISGGSVAYLRTYNSSSVTISGGAVGNWWTPESVTAYDTSIIDVYNGAYLTGGSFSSLEVYDSAVLNVHGGDLNLFLVPRDSSVVNVYGGLLFEIVPHANSTINVYGGYIQVFGENIVVPETATVNIYGYGFSYEAEAEWRSWNGPADGWWVSKLSGYGFDGEAITYLGLPDPALNPNIRFIPEPSTFLLGALGGLWVLRKRKTSGIVGCKGD